MGEKSEIAFKTPHEIEPMSESEFECRLKEMYPNTTFYTIRYSDSRDHNYYYDRSVTDYDNVNHEIGVYSSSYHYRLGPWNAKPSHISSSKENGGRTQMESSKEDKLTTIENRIVIPICDGKLLIAITNVLVISVHGEYTHYLLAPGAMVRLLAPPISSYDVKTTYDPVALPFTIEDMIANDVMYNHMYMTRILSLLDTHTSRFDGTFGKNDSLIKYEHLINIEKLRDGTVMRLDKQKMITVLSRKENHHVPDPSKYLFVPYPSTDIKNTKVDSDD